MDLIGHTEWNQIFNNDLSKIWQEERKELQVTAVLLGALKFELKKVQLQIEEEFQELRKKFEVKEELQDKIQKEVQGKKHSSLNKSLQIFSKPKIKKFTNKENNFKTNLRSPDLFKPTESVNISDNSIIDLSISDDETYCIQNPLPNSPPLNKKKKPYYRLKKRLSQESSSKSNEALKDIFRKPCISDTDETFIDSSEITKDLKCQSNQEQETTRKDSNMLNELINIPNKKAKNSEPEPIIRGKARKTLMKGTTCKDCINFYGDMDLPPGELQKVIDKCSNHRYFHQPREETMPGYWDLTFPDV